MGGGKKEITVAAFKVPRDIHAKLKALAESHGTTIQYQARICTIRGMELVEVETDGESLNEALERIVENKLREMDVLQIKGSLKRGAMKST